MSNHLDLFTQSLEGLPALEEAPATLRYLQDLRETLPLFQQLQSDDILEDLAPFAQRFQAFETVVILGTGGSSLGGQTVLALRSSSAKGPRLHFLDNIDPHTFQALLPTLSFEKTGVIAISKSGNTAETVMQLLVCLQHAQETLPQSRLKDHFLIISEARDNGIRRLAAAYELTSLDHPSDIGGRFAVFTAVGMLPALIGGVDAAALREGARQALASVGKDCPALTGALAHQALAKTGVTQTVLMPYCDRLSTFALWFRQLWAESLGKDGSGITPVSALGTVDQHSQLQLYLDGPEDKVFTVITLEQPTDVFTVTLPPVGHKAVDLFQGKSLGELMMAEQKATIDTLRRHRRPTRVLHLTTLTEKTLGGLMIHYMLETLALSHLMGVNPFDQPAVEEGKILTQQYLAA